MHAINNTTETLLLAIHATEEGDVEQLAKMLNTQQGDERVSNAIATLLCVAEMIQELEEDDGPASGIPSDEVLLLATSRSDEMKR